jgi:hypothetical protein
MAQHFSPSFLSFMPISLLFLSFSRSNLTSATFYGYVLSQTSDLNLQ